MKSFYNIEKSKFQGKQYVGYCNCDVWEIFGRHGSWSARKVIAPIVGKTKMLIGYDTLEEISNILTTLEKE